MNSWFMNPANQYVEKATGVLTWLWALLLGPVYFLYKGAWQFAALYLLIPIYLTAGSQLHASDPYVTGALWIILAPFAYPAIKRTYRRSGWVETTPSAMR